MTAIFVIGAASCNKDDMEELEKNEHNNSEEVNYYDYSEKGFFMNGESMVKGAFESDSVVGGYAKYVKRTAHYRTLDDVEHEITLGYALVVELDGYAKYYSDNVKYSADSTSIKCNGEIMLLGTGETSKATIDARIDSIGKPHLITCRAIQAGKPVTLQFRQTYYKDPYSDIKHPDPDPFDI